MPRLFGRRQARDRDTAVEAPNADSNEAGAAAVAATSSSSRGGLSDELLQSAQGATTGPEGNTLNPTDEDVQGSDARQRVRPAPGTHKEHKYSTARFKHSPRKLNDLSRQIASRPIDEAILQMQFSPKRASKRIASTLALARNHALDKGLDGARLVVAESWVSKGKYIKRLDIKGRGRMGIKEHPQARLHVVLREGKTKSEVLDEKRSKVLRAVRSAGVVREDVAWRNAPINGWRW